MKVFCAQHCTWSHKNLWNLSMVLLQFAYSWYVVKKIISATKWALRKEINVECNFFEHTVDLKPVVIKKNNFLNGRDMKQSFNEYWLCAYIHILEHTIKLDTIIPADWLA